MHPDPDVVPNDSLAAITVSPDGKVKTLTVNAYRRDFQRGLAKLAHTYPDILAWTEAAEWRHLIGVRAEAEKVAGLDRKMPVSRELH